MSIARARAVVGSLYGLLRNRLGLNVATALEAQELSCTVAPDRRLVVLGHDPIAGFARDHGTVADAAAMLALHTLDSATLLTQPRFVGSGDSCLRADDPGWRWHCISGHGQYLADWERRPLGGALASSLAGKADVDHPHVISDVSGLADALDDKQDELANATTIAKITESGGAPLWNGSAWPSAGGGSSSGMDLTLGLRHWIIGRESDNAALDMVTDTTWSWSGTAATTAGRVARALALSGSNHVYGPTGLAIEATGGLTIAAWVRPTGTVSNEQFVFGVNADHTADQRTLFGGLQSTRVFRWLRSIDGTLSWIITNGPGTLSADSWVLLVCVYSPDGWQNTFTLPASGASSRSPATTVNPGAMHYLHANARLAIGAFQHDYTGARFVGAIDSFGIWNRALRPEEVQWLWNAGGGRLFSEL